MEGSVAMSAMGQKQTYAAQQVMSAPVVALMREEVYVAMGMAVSGLTIAALIGASMTDTRANNQRRVLEATVRMERLAKNLEHAKRIAPATSLEVAELIRQPQYDCNQVACGSGLEIRNRAARARLQNVLVILPVPDERSAQATSRLGH